MNLIQGQNKVPEDQRRGEISEYRGKVKKLGLDLFFEKLGFSKNPPIFLKNSI